MEEIYLILEDTKERMEKTLQFLTKELTKVRAGKAMPNMLDGINVDYYNVQPPIIQ